MGIALIAGIAIPAMIIGIPVYVGRKVSRPAAATHAALESGRRLGFLSSLTHLLSQIHNRYEGKDISRHKRNLVIAGGVTLSVIVSPVVAAVTVGTLLSRLCYVCLSFENKKISSVSNLA